MTGIADELQAGLYTKLSAELSCSVYDFVEKGTDYPYVVIEDQYMNPIDALSQKRDQRFFTLSVWSDYSGQKEVNEILQEIYDALHQQRFSTADGRVIRATIVRTSTTREPDNRTFMGQATVQVLVQH